MLNAQMQEYFRDKGIRVGKGTFKMKTCFSFGLNLKQICVCI